MTSGIKHGVMTRECRVNRRGQYPKLRDIDHDEHDQSRLPNCGGLMTFRIDCVVSSRQLAHRHLRLTTDGPNLSVAHFHFNRVERARWWTIKNVSRGGIERAFMTRTFQPLMIARVINRTTQVRTFLPIRVISAVGSANRESRNLVQSDSEIQAAIWRERLSSIDLRRRAGFGRPCVERSLRRKPAAPTNSAAEVSPRKLQNSRRVTCASSSRS